MHRVMTESLNLEIYEVTFTPSGAYVIKGVQATLRFGSCGNWDGCQPELMFTARNALAKGNLSKII